MDKNFNNMKIVFDTIYNDESWKTKNIKSLSGKGSEVCNCDNFINFINNFIIDKNIKTIYDFGCGDCEGIQKLNFENINYTGCDISKKAINIAKLKFKQNNNVNLIQNKNLIIENNYDLLIIKHVLGHWLDISDNGLFGLNCKSDNCITYFLEHNINKFKYIIINDHIDDRIIKFFPNNFKYEKIKFNSYKNKYNSLYIINTIIIN